MVVVAAVEAGQQHLARVDPGVETQIAVDVGVDDQVGRVGNDDLVVDHGDAEGGDQRRFLHKDMARVGDAVAVGVLQHHDPVAGGLASLVAAVVDALRDPDAPLRIDVHVRRITQQRALRPKRDLEALGDGEHLKRHDRGFGRLGSFLGGKQKPGHGAEDQQTARKITFEGGGDSFHRIHEGQGREPPLEIRGGRRPHPHRTAEAGARHANSASTGARSR